MRLALLLAAVLLCPLPAAALQAPSPCVLRMEVEGTLTLARALELRRALDEAEQRGCAATLLVLDSPGAEVAAIRLSLEATLRADRPVLVYVPAGGRAGGAAGLLVFAADVAAMAPDAWLAFTNDVRAPEEAPEQAALARFLAEHRGRSSGAARRTVLEGAAVRGPTALHRGLVDAVASDERMLLHALDSYARQTLGNLEAARFVDVRAAPVAPGAARPFALALLFVLSSVGYLALVVALRARRGRYSSARPLR